MAYVKAGRTWEGGDPGGELRRADQVRGRTGRQPPAHEGTAERVSRAGGVPRVRRVRRDADRRLTRHRQHASRAGSVVTWRDRPGGSTVGCSSLLRSRPALP